MRRFLLLFFFTSASAGALVSAACSSTGDEPGTDPRADASLKRDALAVDPPSSPVGAADAGLDPGAPSCDKYCDLVSAACLGEQSQYRTRQECMGFCVALPPGKVSDRDTASAGCREQFAGTPAKTDPSKNCAAAGPFGGGVCGDRCTAFCQVALSACSPDGGLEAGAIPFDSYATCLTSCSGYDYDDAGFDLDGPTSGNTLNCRLFQLRSVMRAGSGDDCMKLGPNGKACQ